MINHYYDQVDRIVSPAGGEIFKFGGDSCLILFPCPDPVAISSLQSVADSITELCLRLDKRFRRKYGIRFALHGSLSCGNVFVNIVGDPAQHLDYFVDGSAITTAYELAEGAIGIVSDLRLPEAPVIRTDCLPSGRSSYSRGSFLPLSVRQKLKSADDPSELRYAVVIFLKLSPLEGKTITLRDYHNYYSKVQSFVYRYEGVINKIDYTEKGYLILIVFGIPIVHQDDIERAFICANRITQIPTETLNVRLGINYSNIYCGIIGAKRRREYGIIGNAVNIAARLMSYADNGQICMSQEIIPRITMKFETEFIAKSAVKGISGEVEIHKLIRELPEQWSQYQNQFRSFPLCLSWQKTALLNTAITPKGECIVHLHGSTGTGKSYLIWNLCEKLLLSGRPFHLFRADEFVRNMRLEFFYRGIRKLLGIKNFVRQYPELLSWCSAHGISFDPEAFLHFLRQDTLLDPAQAKSEAEVAGAVLFDILAALYDPTDCLVIDPLDHFDPESQVLIKSLAKRNLAAGAMVVFSSASSAIRISDEYFRKVSIPLSNFGVTEGTAFIRHFLPLATPEATSELIRVTGANPRFLSEMVQHIREVRAGASDMITLPDINTLQAKGLIPNSVENLLLADYQHLSVENQRSARIASIYGRPFREAELCEIFELEPDAFKADIQTLTDKNILSITELEPVPVYCFTNPLLRESIYRTILLSDKIHLHETVAGYYEERYKNGENELLELVAHHYIQTGRKEKITLWAGILAEQYLNIGAFELSLRYYEMVADSADTGTARMSAKLSTVEIRLSLAENDLAREFLEKQKALLNAKGQARDRYLRLWVRYYNNTGQFDLMRDFLDEHLAEVQDPVISRQMRIDFMEALLRHNEIELFTRKALPLYEELVLSGSPAEQNTLAGVIAQFYSNQGEYRKALSYYREKARLSDQLNDPVGKRIAQAGTGINLSRLGKKQEAIKYYRAALDTAEKSGDRNGYSKALLNIGTFLRNQGDYDGALEHYRKSLIIARHIGNLLQESIIIYDMGELLAYQEKHDESISYFLQSLELAERIGDDSGKSFCYDAIGDNHFKHGNYREAKEIYEQILILQLRINDREGIAHTYGNLGNIAKMDKDWDTATDFYHKQLDILSQVGDQDGSGRAWFNLAMLDLENDRQDEARSKLEQALELFTACEAKYYIDITKQKLSELQI